MLRRIEPEEEILVSDDGGMEPSCNIEQRERIEIVGEKRSDEGGPGKEIVGEERLDEGGPEKGIVEEWSGDGVESVREGELVLVVMEEVNEDGFFRIRRNRGWITMGWMGRLRGKK